VSGVDHDAQAVAFGDDLTPQRRQAALPGRLGLVVAELATEEVHELELPHAASIDLRDPLDMALEELTALDPLHDGRSSIPVRGFQVARLQDAAQILAADHAARGFAT
jgi:hypothetical protein